MKTRLSIVLAMLVGGCGTDATWFPSDVDERAALAAASPAVRAQVCDAFEDYAVDQWRGSVFVEVACTARAIETTPDAAACSASVEDCIEHPPAEVQAIVTSLMAQVGCGALDYQPTGCAKTFADLRACLDAIDGEVDQLRYALECNLAGRPLPAGGLTIVTPEACRSLELSCPL